MKTESDIGSAITHQFRVSTGTLTRFLFRVPPLFGIVKLYPALCSYTCCSLILGTLLSELGHCSSLHLQIINLGKRLTDAAILEIDWPKETNQEKGLLYLMKISSTGVERIDCSPEGEINPLNLVSEKHHVNAAFAWNLTVGKPDVILVDRSRTVKCEEAGKNYRQR